MRAALLIALALAGPAPTPSPAPSPAPRLTLFASPKTAKAPAQVHAAARLYDYGRELQCPVFVWVWGDDTESAPMPFPCDPYQRPEERPNFWAIRTIKPHVYHRPGTYQLAIQVTAGDQTLRAAGRIVVKGHGLAAVADGGER